MEEQRFDYKFLGVNLGTATGWDDVGPEGINIHGFTPTKGIALPSSASFFIEYDTGKIEMYDDDGNIIGKFDMLNVLRPV